MSETLLQKALKTDFTVNEAFSLHIKSLETPALEIAAAVHVSRSHLCRILKSQRELTETLRKRLNEYLDTNY